MRKSKRQEIKDKLQRTSGYHQNDRQKLARIIDSDEEDFTGDEKWVKVKEELAV